MIEFDNNELARRVDEVLFYVWDPIGVNDEPYAREEYAGYVQEIQLLVEQNVDVKPISSRLFEIVETRMGITVSIEKCDHTAKLLLRHKQAIIDGCA